MFNLVSKLNWVYRYFFDEEVTVDQQRITVLIKIIGFLIVKTKK